MRSIGSLVLRRRRWRPPGKGLEGFTLLEVLVALAMAALFFSIALPVVGTSLARLTQAETALEALMLARSTLSVHMDTQLKEGRYEGRQGRLSWRADVTRDAGSKAGGPLTLRRVEVEVFLGTTSVQKLTSLIVAPVHE